MVLLTYSDGQEIYVNPKWVIAVELSSAQTMVYLANGKIVPVQEKVSEVVELIERAK